MVLPKIIGGLRPIGTIPHFITLSPVIAIIIFRKNPTAGIENYLFI